MIYKFISVDEKAKKSFIWGSFSANNKSKMFLFISYLLNSNNPEQFLVVEEETGKAVKLSSFADYYGISKDDIKNK